MTHEEEEEVPPVGKKQEWGQDATAILKNLREINKALNKQFQGLALAYLNKEIDKATFRQRINEKILEPSLVKLDRFVP